MAVTGHTLRVNQLDALRVDEELLLLLQQEVGAALQHTFPAAAAKYGRELQLLLQLFFFCSYTLRNVPTPGSVLQNVRYKDNNTKGSSGTCGGGSRSSSNGRINATRGRTTRGSQDLSSSTGHKNCSGTGTTTASSISDSRYSNTDSATEHVAGRRGQQLHQQQLLRSVTNHVSQQPRHVDLEDRTRISRSSSKRRLPATQQHLSLRQRLLLLLLSTVLPYCFERVQEYIHRRYIALLAVLQQRMLRTQAMRRMQQQELLRQRHQQQVQSSVQHQQNTSERHEQSQEQLPPHQPFPCSRQQHERQQHGGCCSSSESTAESSSSRSHHSCFGGSSNITGNSRNSNTRRGDSTDSTSQTGDSCVGAGGATATCCGCGSGSQTCCPATPISVSGAAASASASAALAVPAPAAVSSSAAPEVPQPLAASSLSLFQEERRILLLYKASQIAEMLVGVAQLFQTFCFLSTGQYRCLSDWLLLLRMQHIDPSLQRSITLDLLQQQLAWQAVLQLLLMLLPQVPQQQSLLRTLSARLRRIHGEMTARAAQARASCIVFLQQQVRRHVATQRQQQEQIQRRTGGPQQEGTRLLLHQQDEHRREGDSTGAQHHHAVVRANQQHQQQEQEQVAQRHPSEEEPQQPHQQQQDNRAQSDLEQLTSPHEQVTQHPGRIRRRAPGQPGDRREPLMQRERLKPMLHVDSSEERPPQQVHACTQRIFHSIGNRLRHDSVGIRSIVIRHSCLLLLRILQPRPSPAFPVTAATPTPAAATAAAPAAASSIPTTAIDAADTPAAAAAAGGRRASLVQQRATARSGRAADRGERSRRGSRRTLRGQSSSSSERQSSSGGAAAARRNGGRAFPVVSRLENQEGATAGLMQGQQGAPPSARRLRRCASHKRNARNASEAGREEVLKKKKAHQMSGALEKEQTDKEVLGEIVESSRATEFWKQWVPALQHQQEEQQRDKEEGEEQKHEKDGEELVCAFCGREDISLAFRGRNCPHRFCYYCVAAHPTYRQQVKREQEAATAAARRRRPTHVGFTRPVRGSLAAGRATSRTARAAPGTTAEAAAGRGEGRQRAWAAAAGHRRGETRRSSVGLRDEPGRPRRHDGSSNSSGATRDTSRGGDSSSTYNREEKPKRSWLAFFGLTLDDETEEDFLKCPACGALVEDIQWAV